MKKGFTLIELLIVIAIIGVLAVALLPTISGGPGRARDAARIAALSNITVAIESYNIDKGEYPGGKGDPAVCLTEAAGTVGALLLPYFKSGIPVTTSTNTVEDVPCEGKYVYKRLADDGYIVVTTLERNGANNADLSTAADFPAPNGEKYAAVKAKIGAPAADKKNYAVISK